jgi:starch synthase
MKIALVSSEVAPFAKTGGLADVTGALPKYLAGLGAQVRVFLPFYRCVREKAQEFHAKQALPTVDMDWAGRKRAFSIWEGRGEGFEATFLDQPEFFDRDGLYGTSAGDYPDNGDRYAFFSRACLEAMKATGFAPDVIHAHDWQSALVLAYKKYVFDAEPLFGRTKSLFTIHNMGYQGLFDRDILDRVGLPRSLFTMENLEFYGRVNFLKAGILYADAVSTVSIRYSQEIQTEEYGCGLDGLLRARSGVLFGVLNGVDYANWNPEMDKYLAARYRPNDLRGKAFCRQDLLKNFGLSAKGRPLVGMVTRLAAQKGLDILVEALDALKAMDLVLLILGTGDAAIEKSLTQAAQANPGHLSLKLGFDEALAHKIYAGCDFQLIPSRYEPCGLTQMYALKYGTIPIVRATGGLEDTIREFDSVGKKGNGFKFQEYSAAELVKAVERGLSVRESLPDWRAVRRNAMACDFSWGRSAQEYLKLYGRL